MRNGTKILPSRVIVVNKSMVRNKVMMIVLILRIGCIFCFHILTSHTFYQLLYYTVANISSYSATNYLLLVYCGYFPVSSLRRAITRSKNIIRYHWHLLLHNTSAVIHANSSLRHIALQCRG